jgi:copper/silver efflux system protein
MTFIMMKYFNVDANIVALSGIAIAIGTMVDLGIILSENILRHKDEAPAGQSMLTTVYNASTEVATAILTAVSTTIVSFFLYLLFRKRKENFLVRWLTQKLLH